MQSGGLALTKETAAKLDAVMNAKPPGVPASEWLEAAVISVKRGLPVTAETVKGLQQAVFGPRLHQLLATLESELNVWAQQGDAGKSAETAGGNKPAAGVLTGGTTAPVTGNTVTAGVLPGVNADADLPASKAGATGNSAPSGAAGSVETQSGSGMVSNTGSNNGNVNAGNTQAIGSAGQAAAALNADAAAEGKCLEAWRRNCRCPRRRPPIRLYPQEMQSLREQQRPKETAALTRQAQVLLRLGGTKPQECGKVRGRLRLAGTKQQDRGKARGRLWLAGTKLQECGKALEPLRR